jgi:3'(2'), 5'-bisphosphate nucleotidase
MAPNELIVTTMNDHDLLNLAAALATQAGKAIMEIRACGFAVTHKDDASPVTAADHAAESLILAGLRAATPDIPVIAEEEMAAGREPLTGSLFWLIDPLDGTREFANGSNEFTVNVGLIRDGRPVLGAVGVPALDELFTGRLGIGAWKRTAVGTHPITTRPCPAEGAVVLASRHHGNDTRLTEWLRDKNVASVIHMGSALKFCRLAEGAADLYPRFGRTMEWDTAAPQAVLEAAGGQVLTMDGASLGYRKPGWDNPAFFCSGTLE